jgi:isopenicillin-N epimerase
VSWGWHHDRGRPDQRDEWGTTPRLRALEFEGTRDPCPWLAVPAAIDFQAGLGWDRVRGRIAGLVAHVRRLFDGLAGLRLATPAHPELHGSMTAFRLPEGVDILALRDGLWRHRIEAPIVERPEGPLIRVSTHFYNTPGEIGRLAEVLPRLSAP